MSEEPQPQRAQQTMPEDGGGWHRIDAGPHLHMMFHPNRQLLGREADGVLRKSIVVAVTGKREQALRFDPFSVGSHYHIRPSLRGRQIPLWVEEGQKPLEVALKFFEMPLRFRGLLAQAEQRLGVGLCRVAHRGVPAPAAVYRLAPGDWMVGAHFAA